MGQPRGGGRKSPRDSCEVAGVKLMDLCLDLLMQGEKNCPRRVPGSLVSPQRRAELGGAESIGGAEDLCAGGEGGGGGISLTKT